MSSQYSFEENQRLSQRACHLLTGYLPSATKISFDDSDDEKNATNVILAPPSKVIDIANLIKEIFGPDGDEEEEEVDYYQQSKGTLEYYETHCTRTMAIEAIRKAQQYRCGEDYGAGVPCDNTDCYRDYTDNYFQRVFVEGSIYQRLCPDCIPDEEDEDADDLEEHKDKRVKIVLDTDV
jgi:hypothetical protein